VVSQPMNNEYSCAHGAQINFEDLTPYLTYAPNTLLQPRQQIAPAFALPSTLLYG
jgi:hypothetical protein